MQKFRIEMILPDDVDPSDLLTRAQELAVELCTEFAPEDEDGEQTEPDQDAVENEVSVECLPLDAKQGAFHSHMFYQE